MVEVENRKSRLSLPCTMQMHLTFPPMSVEDQRLIFSAQRFVSARSVALLLPNKAQQQSQNGDEECQRLQCGLH